MLPTPEVVPRERLGGKSPPQSSAPRFDCLHRPEKDKRMDQHSGTRHYGTPHVKCDDSPREETPGQAGMSAVRQSAAESGQPAESQPSATGRPCLTHPRHGVSKTHYADYHHTEQDKIATIEEKAADMKDSGHGHDIGREGFDHDSAAGRTTRTCADCKKSCEHNKSWQLTSMDTTLGSLRGVIRLSLWICLILALFPSGARAAPSSQPHDPDYQEPIDGVKYMQKFGYLPQSDLETGALRTEEEMRKAIRKFQAYSHIPITGNMDKTTLDKMASPRCGVADNVGSTGRYDRSLNSKQRDKRYVLGPSKWEKKAITFRILNYTPDLDLSDIRDSIIRAFQLWMEVTQLTFHEVMQGHADIMIKFARGYHADGYPFDGVGMILAHAFFPGEDRGGDMHFDEDETWTIRSHDGTNLYVVAAHELGHALGLAHSSVFDALMYPWYQGYNPNLQLHSDDISGIQYLYGYKYTPIEPEAASTVVPVPGPTRKPTYQPVTPFPTIPYKTSPPVAPTLPTVTPRKKNQPPDPCITAIDVITVIRGEIYAFIGRWFWRIDQNGVMKDYPVEINRFWYNLPEDLEGIDAVYEREPGDGKIIFFKNDRYWIFKGNHLQAGFPMEGQSITELGFPTGVKKVDAAFVWGHNKRTYFITGDMYWRYDEFHGQMEYDYPRDMTMWAGVPVPVSGAFTDNQGVTYFLNGLEYWEFNDAKMHVREDNPHLIGPKWLECEEPVMRSDGTSNSSGMLPCISPLLCIYSLILLLVVQKICNYGHR